MYPIVTIPNKVRLVTGLLSRTRALELEKSDPEFPKRIWIGHSSGWLTSELQSYLSKKAGQSVSADTRQAA